MKSETVCRVFRVLARHKRELLNWASTGASYGFCARRGSACGQRVQASLHPPTPAAKPVNPKVMGGSHPESCAPTERGSAPEPTYEVRMIPWNA